MANEHSQENEVKLEKDLDLRQDFPPTTYQQWREAAEAGLKGASFEKKLVTNTYENIELQPVYTKEDLKGLSHLGNMPGFSPYVRGTKQEGYLASGWDICQELPYGTPALFNKALKNDLQRGQTAVNLILDPASRRGVDADIAPVQDVGSNGTSLSTLEDLKAALDGVDLKHCAVNISAGAVSLNSLMMLAALAQEQDVDFADLKGSVEADPYAALVADGSLKLSLDSIFMMMAKANQWAAAKAPGIKTTGCSGLPYHRAGASAVQELGFVLATAVEYLNRLMEQGLTIDEAASHIRFTFGVGSFYFMEVAKLRAARLCWSKIVESFGGSEEARKMTIHGRTSTFNQTIYDPYVNMLRTTTEAFSAVVGGVDSLHTNAFDESIREADEFSRRIARNTQIILSEETHLDNLIDPAGGSYFVESLTDKVAGEAWTLMQTIEGKGGMLKALQEGFPQAEIAAVVEKRKKDAAKRKNVMVGINMYANPKEQRLEERKPEPVQIERSNYMESFKMRRIQAEVGDCMESLSLWKPEGDDVAGQLVNLGIEAFICGVTSGEVTACIGQDATQELKVQQILPIRLADMFETIREAADSYKDKTGAAPKLFLACMGPLGQYKARADFSRGFFEVGGFDVVYPNKGFATPEEAVAAAAESKAPVVVVCSTDDTYPELVPPLVKGVKAGQPNATVVLAGFPKDQVDAHRESGVDEFIYLGADAYHIISSIYQKIGVMEQ